MIYYYFGGKKQLYVAGARARIRPHPGRSEHPGDPPARRHPPGRPRQGLFRDDVDATDVHMMISAYCVFRVANRHTFGTIFGRDMVDPKRREHYRALLGDRVVRSLAARRPPLKLALHGN
jgi:Tetracyclin repressor-like, C-terminal domain